MTGLMARPTGVRVPGPILWLVGMIGANLFLRLPRLDDPLTQGWQFRYTQTAFTVRSFMRDGFNPFTVQLPIFGPPWRVPMEFPLFQMMAAGLGEVFRLDATVAARLAATISFAAGAVVLFWFVGRLFDHLVAQVAVAIYLWSPFGLDWGSQVLIDFTATALCLAALALVWLALDRRMLNGRVLTVYVVLAMLGSLTKVTTAVSWLAVGIPLLMWRYRPMRASGLLMVAMSAAAAVPVAIWTWWSDRVKGESEFTAFLASREMRDFNFGTLEQRLDMEQWRDPFERFAQSLVGYSLLGIVLLAAAILLSPRRRDVVVLVAIGVSAPLIFFNLYGHDYYPIAIYPVAATALAVGIVEIIRRVRDVSRRERGLALGGVALVCCLAAISSNGAERLGGLRATPELWQASEIRSVTRDDDLVIVVGDDWSSATLFHADRRGMMYREKGPRLDADELGTTYRYVYWHNTEPFDNWGNYFPPELRYEWVSGHVLRIFPIGA